MQIPTSFKLINRPIEVVEMSEETYEVGDAHGAWRKDVGTIVLHRNGNQNNMEHTFHHELCHAMLEAAGRDDLSKDEDFVDLLGAVLHQYMQTKKGKFGNQ